MRLALTGDYDLILLDVMLPGMDGFEICRRIRGEIDTPIMMVTARRSDIDKIRGLGFGADEYIENRSRRASSWRVSRRSSPSMNG